MNAPTPSYKVNTGEQLSIFNKPSLFKPTLVPDIEGGVGALCPTMAPAAGGEEQEPVWLLAWLPFPIHCSNASSSSALSCRNLSIMPDEQSNGSSILCGKTQHVTRTLDLLFNL